MCGVGGGGGLDECGATARVERPADGTSGAAVERTAARAELSAGGAATGPFVAARVQLKNPKPFGGDYPGGQTIRIRLKDGRTLVASRDRDHVLRPDLFTDELLTRKFLDNVAFSGLCAPVRAEAIASEIMRLDNSNAIARFIRQCFVFQKPTNNKQP